MLSIVKKRFFNAILVLSIAGCGQEDLVFPDSGVASGQGECGAAYATAESTGGEEGTCFCIQEEGIFPCLVWESARQNGQDIYISAEQIYLDAKHGLTDTRSLIIVVSAENCSTCAIVISALKNRAAEFEAAGAYMMAMARRSLTGSTEDPDFDLDKAELVLARESWPLTWPITNDEEGYLSRTFDTATPWIIVVDVSDMRVKVASNQRFTPDPSGVEELLSYIKEF